MRRLPPWVLLGLCCGCGGALDERPARWDYLHEAIVRPSCATAGCHDRNRQAGGVTLEDPTQAAALLLEERYVIPGDPASPLLFLLEGVERNRMPPDAPLPAADVALIRRWIEEGAVTE